MFAHDPLPARRLRIQILTDESINTEVFVFGIIDSPHGKFRPVRSKCVFRKTVYGGGIPIVNKTWFKTLRHTTYVTTSRWTHTVPITELEPSSGPKVLLLSSMVGMCVLCWYIHTYQLFILISLYCVFIYSSKKSCGIQSTRVKSKTNYRYCKNHTFTLLKAGRRKILSSHTVRS